LFETTWPKNGLKFKSVLLLHFKNGAATLADEQLPFILDVGSKLCRSLNAIA